MAPHHLLLFVSLWGLSHSYPTGAPTSACDDMVPQHGTLQRDSASPYVVRASSTTYRAGQQITVTIENSSFKGFFLQARKAGTSTRVGRFQNAPSEAQYVTCTFTADAITHVDRNDKSSVTVTWVAPANGEGDIEFVATIVEQQTSFWVQVKSAIVFDQEDATASSLGSRFYLMFLDITGSQDNPELYLSTSSLTTVVTSTPRWNDFQRSTRVSSNFPINLERSIRMEGSGRSTKGILVESTEEIYVRGLNKEALSADGFLALPVEALGTDYYAVTYTPQGDDVAQVGVVGVSDGTVVCFELPAGSGMQFEYNGLEYVARMTLCENINELDTIQIQSSFDLTGLHIYSSHAVAAFSGNKAALVGGTSATPDHLVTQLIPVKAWGVNYVVAPLPDRDSENLLRIVASEPDTVVTFQSGSSERSEIISGRGLFWNYEENPGNAAWIVGSKPIMVTMFGRSQSDSGIGDATMSQVPPVGQFNNDYRFSTPDGSGDVFTCYVIVAMGQTETTNVELDGGKVDDIPTQWALLDDPTGVIKSQMAVKVIPVSAGGHVLSNPSGEGFGAVLYGYTRTESFSFPLGLKLGVINDRTCIPSPTVISDKIDNDCDGRFDEELCDNLDDDSDGYLDEDCYSPDGVTPAPVTTQPTVPTTRFTGPTPVPSSCTVDHFGREFYVSFMESARQTSELLQLLVTGTSDNWEQVTVRSMEDNSQITSFQIQKDVTETVLISKNLEVTGSGLSMKSVYISSPNSDISVIAINSEPGACGGTQVLPADALGTEYYVLSYWPDGGTKPWSQFTVVSPGQSTMTITFPPNKGIAFEYDGSTYDADTPLVLSMTNGQVFQIQNKQGADLSGTKVTSTSPVAVYSGVAQGQVLPGSESDHMYEQMPPVYTYGRGFVIADLAAGSGLVYVLAAEDNTEVRLDNVLRGNIGAAQLLTIPEGEIQDTVYITTDKPVLVGLYLTSDFPSFVLIPPIDRWTTEYYLPETGYESATLYFTFSEPLTVYNRVGNQVFTHGTSTVGSEWIQSMMTPAWGRMYSDGALFSAYGRYLNMDDGCAVTMNFGMCYEDRTSTTVTSASTMASSSTTAPTPTQPTQPTTPSLSTISTAAPPQPAGPCTQTNAGSEFMVVFMETEDNNQDMVIYASDVIGTSITVNIDTPSLNPMPINEQVTISPSQMVTITIPASLRVTSSTKSQNVVRVRTSGGDITLSAVNRDSTCGGYLVLPVTSLNTEYHVSMQWPNLVGARTTAQLAVAAYEDNTDVTLYFWDNKGVNVVYDGETYSQGRSLQVTLNRFEVLQVQDSGTADLSGTRVVSDRRIAVYSGNIHVAIGSASSSEFTDHLVEQIPPTTTYGTHFVTVPTPQRFAIGYDVKVVAKNDGTTVEFSHDGSRYNLQASEFLEKAMTVDAHTYITSSEPVLVTQFIRSTLGGDTGLPALLVVPPTEQYLNQYVFTATGVSQDFTHYIMITTQKGTENSVFVDGADLSTSSWEDVPGTNMVATWREVGEGRHRVYHGNSDITIGAWYYGYSSTECSVAYPVGMCLDTLDGTPPVTLPSTTAPVSTLSTTEPTVPTNTQPTQPSTTQPTQATTTRPTEPTSTKPAASTSRPPVVTNCEIDNVGREFTAMFLENKDTSENPVIYLTSASSSAAMVTIDIPDNGRFDVNVNPGMTETFSVSGMRLTGSEKGRKSIHVSATGDIAVMGLNVVGQSIGSFLVMPNDALGTRYFISSWWSATAQTDHFSHLGVAAHIDNTQVEMIFPAGRGITVTYEGNNYDQNTPLTVTLNNEEAIQIQAEQYADLSGTIIQATQRVAVFSGNRQTTVSTGTEDTIVEQMPQENTLGREFVVVPTPGSSASDYVKIIATTEEDTFITMTGYNEREMSQGEGHYIELEVTPGTYTSLTTNNPVLVTQFITGMANSPAMLVVTPVEQYRYEYHFTVPDTGVTTQGYIVLIVEVDYINGIRVNNNLLSTADWSPVDSTKWRVRELSVGSGTYHVTHYQNAARFGTIVMVLPIDGGSPTIITAAGACYDDLIAAPTPGTTTIPTSPTVVSTPTPVSTSTGPTDSSTSMPGSSSTTATVPTSTIVSSTATGSTVVTESSTMTSTAASTSPFTTIEPNPYCAQSNKGRRFLVMFLENRDEEPVLEIYSTTPSMVSLSVEAPNAAFLYNEFLSPGEVVRVPVPNNLVFTGTGKGNTALLIEATGNIVVHGYTHSEFSSGGFLVFPIPSLGMDYHATSWWPPSLNTQIGVAAVNDDTQVSLTLPSNHGCQVEYDGQMYSDTDTIDLTLQAYETLQLQDLRKCDLSGTRITSTQPIAVFSGNMYTSVPADNTDPADNMVEQVPPVFTYGTLFYTTPTPGRFRVTDRYTFISAEDDTTVSITGQDDLALTAANMDAVRSIGYGAIIRSDKPILVTQFIPGDSATADDGGSEPSMAVIPPVTQYLNTYEFVVAETLGDDSKHLISVVIEDQYKDGLKLNGNPLGVAFTPIEDDLAVVHGNTEVTPGAYTLNHDDPMVFFGAYIYGISGDSDRGYAFPVGMCLDDKSKPPPTSAPTAFPCPLADGNYENPDDCTTYFTCVGGVDTLIPCPGGQHFSQNSRVCMDANLADCEPGPSEDNLGATYILMFGENPPNDGDIFILISTPYRNPVDVTVDIVNTDGVDFTLTVSKGNDQMVTLPADLRTTGTGISDKSVIVDANNGIAVTTLNQGSCGGYLAIPIEDLGNEHYALSWSPGETQLGVISTVDGNSVSITLPDDVTVTFNGVTYNGGDTIDLTMNKYNVAYFQTSDDLSGTHITSSNPVMVMTGNSDVTIGAGTITDQTESQLLPTEYWGKIYPLLPIPNIPAEYYYKVVAMVDGTIVTSSRQMQDTMLNAGEVAEMTVDDNDNCYVTANHPIQVVQYVTSSGLPGASWFAAPTSIVVTPVEQFTDDYFFNIPPQATGTYTNYLMIVIPSGNEDDMFLDGVPLISIAWENVMDSSPQMVETYFEVDPGAHRVKHRYNVKFGAYVYGVSENDCSFGYPAGMAMDDLSVATNPPLPGPTITSPDAGCSVDTFGERFIVMFLENIQADFELEMIPATTSLDPITVSVRTPMWTSPEVSETYQIQGGRIHTVTLPKELRMSGNVRSTTAVEVTASSPIALYVLTKEAGSCDGFVAIPVDALGTSYYTVTHFPPSNATQIGLVATEPDTTVSLTFVDEFPEKNIEFEGTVYRESMTVTMDMYETIQLQHPGDLSGTYITSNKPIAVFNGNKKSSVATPGGDVSYLVEMVPPISALGYTFYFIPTPDRPALDDIKIVATQDMTKVKLTELPENVFFIAGDKAWLPLPIPNTFPVTVIKADKPIMVAQFIHSGLPSDTNHDPAMFMLTPAEQWKPQYTFATPGLLQDGFRHYILIAIAQKSLPMLMLDGVQIDQSDWTVFEDTDPVMLGRAVEVTWGVHILYTEDEVPFGAHVYGASEDDCAYAYPAGYCLGPDPVQNTTAGPTNYTTVIPTDFTTDVYVTTEPPACLCDSIDVTSTFLQPAYQGIYHRLGYTHNGRPVFKNEDCEQFIYYVTSNISNYWLMSTDPYTTNGHVLIQGNYTLPDIEHVNTTWRAYDKVNGTWRDDVTVRVTCVCNVTDGDSVYRTCSNVTIRGPSPTRSVPGSFSPLTLTHNARPVYLNTQFGIYLYHYVDATCNMWVAGPVLGAKAGIMYTHNTSIDPLKIAGTWTVLANGAWDTESSISLLCES